MASRCIPDSERNKVIAALRKVRKNNRCIDCGAPNPQWASVSFGIMFCLECSGQHRHLGTHLSFVRSLTMDSFKPNEIAAMKVGGNAAMIEWWQQHDVDPRASIQVKYKHPATQLYKEKIKAMIAGRPWDESTAGKSSGGKKKKKKKPSSSSSSRSKRSGGSSSKSRSPATRAAAQPSKDPFALGSSGGHGVGYDDDDDDSFESFLSDKPRAQKNVPVVPNYGQPSALSNPDLQKYSGSRAIGSDDLYGNGSQPPPQNDPADEILAMFSNGWSKLSVAAQATKDKLVEGTTTLKDKVEASGIKEKAAATTQKGWGFIQALWNGEVAPQGGPQQQQQGQQQAYSQQQQQQQQQQQRGAGGMDDAQRYAAWKAEQEAKYSKSQANDDAEDGWGAWDEDDTPAAAERAGGNDGWGAWEEDDAGAAKNPALKQAIVPQNKANDDSAAWGAWGEDAAPDSPVTTTAIEPVVGHQSSLVDLDFAHASQSTQQQQPVASNNGLDGLF